MDWWDGCWGIDLRLARDKTSIYTIYIPIEIIQNTDLICNDTQHATNLGTQLGLQISKPKKTLEHRTEK